MCQYWWNVARTNYSKGRKTPLDFLLEEGYDPSVLFIEPIHLDLLFRNIDYPSQVGQVLPKLPDPTSDISPKLKYTMVHTFLNTAQNIF